MKKIINGKTYNTQTASEIAYNWNGKDQSDLRYFQESLYITKKGDLFMYTTGGAYSTMAEKMDNGWLTGSSEIIPYSKAMAQNWFMIQNEEIKLVIDRKQFLNMLSIEITV